MSKNISSSAFAQLFSLFRARSTLVSLAQLGDNLAELNLILDHSTFSNWNRGTRVPRERVVVLKLVKVLWFHQGIRTFEEANQLLNSCRLTPLSPAEQAYLTSHTHIEPPTNQPTDLATRLTSDTTETYDFMLNLLIPAQMNRYITQQAIKLGVSKAAIIRQIIEREMLKD